MHQRLQEKMTLVQPTGADGSFQFDDHHEESSIESSLQSEEESSLKEAEDSDLDSAPSDRSLESLWAADSTESPLLLDTDDLSDSLNHDEDDDLNDFEIPFQSTNFRLQQFFPPSTPLAKITEHTRESMSRTSVYTTDEASSFSLASPSGQSKPGSISTHASKSPYGLRKEGRRRSKASSDISPKATQPVNLAEPFAILEVSCQFEN